MFLLGALLRPVHSLRRTLSVQWRQTSRQSVYLLSSSGIEPFRGRLGIQTLAVSSQANQSGKSMWQPLYDPLFVLPPKHAAAFRLAAGTFSDIVGWEAFEDDWDDIGVAVFDNLTQHQKQAAILIVAKALLDPDCEPPDVTAVLAGTVDAIYLQLESTIELEIGQETSVRQLILEVMEEMDYWTQVNSGLGPDEEPFKKLAQDSEDMDEWQELVEAMRTEILDDVDFSMEHEFMDMPPDKAAALENQLNIDPDYFVAVIEDPTPERLKKIREEIKAYLY